jgi:hypothetical protein
MRVIIQMMRNYIKLYISVKYSLWGVDIRRFSFIIYTKREGVKVCTESHFSGTFIPFLFVKFTVLHTMQVYMITVRLAVK